MWNLQRLVRSTIAFVVAVGAMPAIAGAPPIKMMQYESQRQWILIHSNVPFIVPGLRSSGAGTAYVSWEAMSGATEYQYRLLINGVWSSWISVGQETYVNLSNLGSSASGVTFEVRSCDASGCGTTASSIVVASSWQNVGSCDPRTGKQMQVCVHSLSCTLNSTRYVDGGCQQSVDCP